MCSKQQSAINCQLKVRYKQTYNQYPLCLTCSAKVTSWLVSCLGSDFSPPTPTNTPE